MSKKKRNPKNLIISTEIFVIKTGIFLAVMTVKLRLRKPKGKTSFC